MEFKDILSISGQSGLFKFVAQSRNGVIVESLVTGTRSCAPSTARVSALSEIAIFTETEELPLIQVMESLCAKTEGKPTIDSKSSPDELKRLFSEVIPSYDRSRFHVSDMKKVVTWFNILIGAGMTDFSTKSESAAESDSKVTE